MIRAAENPRVVFIYPHGVGPCHAVVKKADGIWSKNRVGFCGTEPASGPLAWMEVPQGGLCAACAKHIEQDEQGVYRAREKHADPQAEELAAFLYTQEVTAAWPALPERARARRRRAARAAIDRFGIRHTITELSGGFDDD